MEGRMVPNVYSVYGHTSPVLLRSQLIWRESENLLSNSSSQVSKYRPLPHVTPSPTLSQFSVPHITKFLTLGNGKFSRL